MNAATLQVLIARVQRLPPKARIVQTILSRPFISRRVNFSLQCHPFALNSAQLPQSDPTDHRTPPLDYADVQNYSTVTETESKPQTDFKISIPDIRRSSGIKKQLPVSCPGCGAFAQEIHQGEAGYYNRSRKAVRAYLKQSDQPVTASTENAGADVDGEVSKACESAVQSKQPGDKIENVAIVPSKPPELPICDRCHNLTFNSSGTSIAHPSIENIADSIAESPFSRNHVYHVLDAADFPMSLIPGINRSLSLAKPRSQNRRSQHDFSQKPTLSFIITRSDLLGPTKEMVDTMMTYFQSALRTALGRTGREIRLGNLHLVSAKRGWWTTEIKETIWKRGGGNWMVGKFNVGKSNLFEVLFPRGSGEKAPVYAELERQQSAQTIPELDENASQLSTDSLLPPPQPESPFPVFPLVSNLPGTTASPIRLPFGGHRGELIDLPGLQRSSLEDYVHPDHKLDLVMTSRPNVTQHNIKAGQSLLLGGGLVRITPVLNENESDIVILAYPFLPLDAHVTSTEKAMGLQVQERVSGLKTILADEVGAKIRSAGLFSLDSDITKKSAGPLLRAGVPISNLPFRVYSTDLLIEGVGWVELVCQVRRSRSSPLPGSKQVTSEDPSCSDDIVFKPFEVPAMQQAQTIFPHIEVFTPNGQHVGQRQPLGAWKLWNDGKQKQKKASVTRRPRRPMKGTKQRRNQSES